MLARYQSNSTFFAQFQREAIQKRLVGQYLDGIEQYAKAALSPGVTPTS